MYNCCSGNTYEVTLGATRSDAPESGSLTVITATTIVHSQYDPITINNDIAVVRLPSAVTFNSEYCHTVINLYIILLNVKQIKAQAFICVIYLCF